MEHQLFKISQNVIFTRTDNSILILKHKSGDKWLLPGGRINKGENWLDGLKREIKEEIGIDQFKIKWILDVDTWIENNDDSDGNCVITFIADMINHDIILGGEHNSYSWVNKSDLDKYNFWNENIKKRIIKFFQITNNTII